MKKILLLLMALLAAPFAQAIELINMPATSSLAAGDLIYVVTNLSTGGTSQKITLANFATSALVQMPTVFTLTGTQTVTGPKTFTALLSGTITNAIQSGTADYATTSSSASHADSAAALDDGGASLSVNFATTAQSTPNGHTLDDLWNGASGNVAYATASGTAAVLSGSLNAAQLGVSNTWSAVQDFSLTSLKVNPVNTRLNRFFYCTYDGYLSNSLSIYWDSFNSTLCVGGTASSTYNFSVSGTATAADFVANYHAFSSLFNGTGGSVATAGTAGTLSGTIPVSHVSGLFTGTNTWTAAQTFSLAPILSSFTVGYVPFIGSSGTLSQSAKLYWDSTNNRLGIGTTSPQWSVQVTGSNGNIANMGALSTATYAMTGGAILYAASDSGTAFINSSRVGQFVFAAAVDASHALYNTSSISCFATEATNGAGGFGSNLQFFTTTNGTNVRTAKMTLGHDGALSVVGSLTFGGGATIQKELMATGTLAFPAIASGTYAELTLAVAGANDGDIVTLGIPAACMAPNCVFQGYVSASGTVTIRCLNGGAASRTPASGLFRAAVVQF